ncbi:HAMP domain-containing sensor histidine kinase [Geovibrio sp. ADMFC3]
MSKGKPFIKLFMSYFIVVTLATVIVFVFAGLKIMDRFFSHYVDMIHAETQQMLATKVSMHYMMYHTWNDYDGTETGESAKISGDYFTLKDNDGHVVYTTEDNVERCCANENHVYTNMTLPVTVDGKTVGTLTAGYFTNHITSPEEEAFRKSGAFLIVLSVFAISVIGAFISLLFFYRLSKPINSIAKTAGDISKGDLTSRIEIKSTVREMNQIATSINALGESLLNQERFRRDLTTELSHELRTPLQILLNQVEAIIDGIYTADSERMESMHAEITRLAQLLDELEDRLMYDNENFDIMVSPADISEITKKLCIGYQGSMAKKGLQMHCDIEDSITLKLDKVRYSQMIINILSNSLKYTARGSVSISLKRSGSKITLTIADTGEGISQDAINSVFDRFYHSDTYKTSRGVGLYLVKLIVDKHGWMMNIASHEGIGTTFEIILSK